jgi:hypothetical protein
LRDHLRVHPALAKKPGLVSFSEIIRYLEVYRVALENCPARLVLFTLPQGITFASRDINRIAEHAVRQATIGRDVYLHIHLHDLPEGETPRRGSIETVRAAIGILSDIDCVGPGRKKPVNTLCGSFNDAAWILDQFTTLYKPLRPSLVVRSGYGLCPALRFREPLVIAGPNDRKRLDDLGRRFHTALHAIASGRGWTGAVDFCDLAKVLRFPGVVNWKDPAQPQPVTMVYDAPARFDPSELEEILPVVRGRYVTGDSAETRSEGVVLTTASITADPNVEIPPFFLDALRETNPKFGPTWDNARPDLDDQSCSGYDMALAGLGVGFDLTDQQIAELIVVHRREFAGEKKDRHGSELVKYLERTIAKARAGKQSSARAEENWAASEKDLAGSDAHRRAPGADAQIPGGGADTGVMERARDVVELPSAIAPDSGATPPFEKFELLCGADRRFRPTWDHRRADLKDQSQPGYDQMLANAAAKAHWADSEIVSLIIANRRKFGVEPEADQDYCRKTVARARELAEPIVLDQQLAKLVEPGNTEPVVAGDLPMVATADRGGVEPVIAKRVVSDSTEEAVNADDDTAGPSPPPEGAVRKPNSEADVKRAAILKLLSARFKVPIGRIVRYTGEPTLYRLETGLGDVQLGGVAGLINQSKLRISIADATGRYLPQIDSETWPSVAQALLDACESVDRGQDATLRGTMSEWLRAYLSEKSIHVTLEKADEGREPFMDNGAVVIFSGDFKRWLQIRQNERVTQGRLTADLRAFGAEPGVYRAVIHGKPTTRSAWRLPHGPWIPTGG